MVPLSAVQEKEGSATVALEGGGGSGGGPTTIHIHFNQESCLSSLWKALQHLRRPSPPAAKEAAGPEPLRAPAAASGGEQKVLGGAQILLGAFCVALGFEVTRGFRQTAFYYNDYTPEYIRNGCAFWMGSVFIVAGLFSVMGARLGGYWVHLATFLNLGSVVTGTVGFVQSVTEVDHFKDIYWYFTKSACEQLKRQSHEWLPGVTPAYNPTPDGRWEESCKAFVEAFLIFSYEVQVLILVFAAVAVAISLFSLGYGLRLLCCRFWAKVDDYHSLEEQEALSPSGNKEDLERGEDAA